MEIKRHIVKIRDLTEGYVDLEDDGVTGYGGRLEIRPPYQRNFVYGTDRQIAVIDSVMNGFPLGIMYWVDREDGTYEVLDGQQRIISIGRFFTRGLSLKIKSSGKPVFFDGLTLEEQESFLDYELDVYICRGSERDKLDWFERINVVGVQLTQQELRNATYTGPWLTSAKSYFSRKNNAAVDEFSEYMKTAPEDEKKIRQGWLKTVIAWKSHADYGKVNIDRYMSEHQQDENALELWQYYFRVMNWVKAIFIKFRSQMKGQDWGLLYNKYAEHVLTLNPDEVEKEISWLMKHQDVVNKRGIYEYIFDSDEKHLRIRAFDDKQRAEAYEMQEGKCAICGEKFAIEEMHADHIIPFSKGGLTEAENCQMLCRKDNLMKSNKY